MYHFPTRVPFVDNTQLHLIQVWSIGGCYKDKLNAKGQVWSHREYIARIQASVIKSASFSAESAL